MKDLKANTVKSCEKIINALKNTDPKQLNELASQLETLKHLISTEEPSGNQMLIDLALDVCHLLVDTIAERQMFKEHMNYCDKHIKAARTQLEVILENICVEKPHTTNSNPAERPPTDIQPSHLPVSSSSKQNQTAAPPEKIRIYMFNSFHVELQEHHTPQWPAGKGSKLLKYLISNRQTPIQKEILMDLFWPSLNISDAKNNLNVAMYGLRKSFKRIDKKKPISHSRMAATNSTQKCPSGLIPRHSHSK